MSIFIMEIFAIAIFLFTGTVIYENGKYYLSTRDKIAQKYYATAFNS